MMKSKPHNRKTRRKTADSRNTPTAAPPPSNTDFLIAAVGASAGGIDAFGDLVRNLPNDTGMAFVLIQHLDPRHRSILAELIAKETAMKVAEVRDGMKVEPNHVYVIPPDNSMFISDHSLRLVPRSQSASPHMVIDYFMRSLAEDHGPRSVGVILSGTGTDGTLGIAEIQARGGVTFAQDEATAQHDNMPRSAIAGGHIDYVLPPKEIARELARIADHPYISRKISSEFPGVSSEQFGLGQIFGILRQATGVDFKGYRKTTIQRRIQRRMVVHKIDDLKDYVRYVQANPAEVKTLYEDMLINVTSFFRNRAVFDALKRKVFPAIMKQRTPAAAVRVWTPGCSSGEEPYSVAIALLEFLGNKSSQTPIQIFGTDLSESVINRARAGVFPENIQGDVSPDRLRRFFTKSDGRYMVSKTVREMCIFAQHNVVSDAPFSQMDLICCRNVLIYLEPPLQNKVISLFHYALRPGGFLVLGSSEGVGMASSLFAAEDAAFKIFRKKATATRQVVSFSLQGHPSKGLAVPAAIASKPSEAAGPHLFDAQKEFDRRLLSHYSPSAVFINEDAEILHIRGNVNRYLNLPAGRANLNLLKLALGGLPYDLRSAINRAKKERRPVKKQNVSFKSADGNGNGSPAATRFVNFEVTPVPNDNLKESYFMIVFEEVPSSPVQSKSQKRAADRHERSSQVRRLEQELAATKEHLQSVIETQEATNEELQSANEEILSSNEELQSTNEELETAKEELQSANEELSTVNDELRSRNTEVNQINTDLTNLLTSVGIAVIIVGSDLTIRRFTQRAELLFGLIPGDVGRPLENVSLTTEIPDLQRTVEEVVSKGGSGEKLFADRKGNRFLARVQPYRTAENTLEGAVVSLIDIPANASARLS